MVPELADACRNLRHMRYQLGLTCDDLVRAREAAQQRTPFVLRQLRSARNA